MMFEADVYIEDGIIKLVGSSLHVSEDTRVIDATGHFVIPGGIDTHTHLDLPFMGTRSVDDFYTGTRAALAGGTTMIIDFVFPESGESLIQAYRRRRSLADVKVCCDYSLHVCLTWWSNKVAHQMEELTKQHGINSFKLCMAYKDSWQLCDGYLIEAFKKCKKLGALAMVYAENGDAIKEISRRLLELGITGPEAHEMSHPEEVEAEATNRACVLASQVNCPLYIVHVTSKSTANLIASKKRQGQVVFGEPLAASLGTDGTNYYHKSWQHAAAHVLVPPLRLDPTTPQHLMNLLADGSLQVTGSDNCTFSSAQKALGKDDFTKIPHGVNGIEERMSLVWEKGVVSGKMDPCKFVAVTSTNAAKIFNIYPKKGRITSGSDADIVVWNPNATHIVSAKTHNLLVDFNIFEGMKLHGIAEYVVCHGQVVVDKGDILSEPGMGKFVPTPSRSPFIYRQLKEKEKVYVSRKVDRLPYDGPVIQLNVKSR